MGKHVKHLEAAGFVTQRIYYLSQYSISRPRLPFEFKRLLRSYQTTGPSPCEAHVYQWSFQGLPLSTLQPLVLILLGCKLKLMQSSKLSVKPSKEHENQDLVTHP